MNLSINDDLCWICGKKESLTTHHVIPKHMSPLKNMTIPLCKHCHHKINSVDTLLLEKYNTRLLSEISNKITELKRKFEQRVKPLG